MSPEVIAYPFLFITIFFEAFLLVTFLSAPAKRARERIRSLNTPSVAIIVPCHNEAATLTTTVDSVLNLRYPENKLSLVLVDNNSTDATPEVMNRYASHPQVRIIREEKLGKYHAVNAGIAVTSAEIIGCLDADSYVEPDSLREIIGCFDTENVAAATAAMSVANPRKLFEHMQNAEYIFGIMLKHVMSVVNGIHVTPGPFSLYRREIILALGGFRSGYQTEDLEMALRLQRAGHLIDNAPKARVYTKTPPTLRKLIRQRTRWTTGFLRNILHDYRELVGNSRYGALGLITLPIGTLAIMSGIGLFGLTLFLILRRVVHAIIIHIGVPYTFSLGHFSFDWFYLPLSLYILLIVIVVGATLAMIAIGKSISETPGSLGRGLVAYVLLYGFLAPLWLMRATADVMIGIERTWR